MDLCVQCGWLLYTMFIRKYVFATSSANIIDKNVVIIIPISKADTLKIKSIYFKTNCVEFFHLKSSPTVLRM